jgi:predicted metal-dependent phosphoesterase TrpH
LTISIDLHLHSRASDGALTPASLVAHAAAHGVRTLALTDHDTLAGLEEAQAAALVLGVTFVRGIELSASHGGHALHVVGLGLGTATPALDALVAVIATQRNARALEIAHRLDRAGAPGTEALVLAQRSTPRPTRTHFARALVQLGHLREPQQAFDRYLGRGGRAHVPGEWPALENCIAAIHSAGGVAVLAHPLRYALSNGQRRRLAAEFRDLGGEAVEVATGGGSREQLESGVALALCSGLEGSVGSDFHDPATAWNQPGRLAKLPASVRPVWRRLGVGADAGTEA